MAAGGRQRCKKRTAEYSLDQAIKAAPPEHGCDGCVTSRALREQFAKARAENEGPVSRSFKRSTRACAGSKQVVQNSWLRAPRTAPPPEAGQGQRCAGSRGFDPCGSPTALSPLEFSDSGGCVPERLTTFKGALSQSRGSLERER